MLNLKMITIESIFDAPKGYFFGFAPFLNRNAKTDINDNAKLISEYIPSNKIICESTIKPMTNPVSAKARANTAEKIKLFWVRLFFNMVFTLLFFLFLNF